MPAKSIIIATNRAPLDESLHDFGDKFNPDGPEELRFLTAERDPNSDVWRLSPVEEPAELTDDNSPSKNLFNSLLASIQAGELGSKWLITVHGFSANFRESLDGAYELQHRYSDINIILFSWPADPGGSGIFDKFEKAARAARISAGALEKLLERIYEYFVIPSLTSGIARSKELRVSLHLHSLGCRMLPYLPFDSNSLFSNIFLDNIIVHQAAVPASRHAEWIDRVACAKRLYITLNQNDSVLLGFRFIRAPALGTSFTGLNGKRPIYLDFTRGRLVESQHNLLLELIENNIIRLVCRRLLNGEDALHDLDGIMRLGGPNGFSFDTVRSCWQMNGGQ